MVSSRALVRCAAVIGSFAVLVVAAVAAPAGHTAQSAPKSLVGTVAGVDAFVGLVLRGVSATAYLSDGQSLGLWFSGTHDGSTARLRDADGRMLIVRLGAAASTGTVSLAGRGVQAVSLAPASGRAGLYRNSGIAGQRSITGWVRLNDGRLKGTTVSTAVRVTKQLPDLELLALATSSKTSPAKGAPVSGFELVGGGRVLCCPLPPAGSVARRVSTVAVSKLPPGFPADKAALRRFAKRILVDNDRRTSKALQRFGLVDPRPTPTVALKLADAAGRMLADEYLRTVLTRLASATPSVAAPALADAKRAVKPYLDSAKRLLPVPGAVVSRSRPTAGKTTPRRDFTITGPYTQIETVTKDGIDAQYKHDWDRSDEGFSLIPQIQLYGSLTNSTSPDLYMDARAGFASKVSAMRANVLAFVLPPNAGNVEIDVYMNRHRHTEEFGCGGSALWIVSEFEGVYYARTEGVFEEVAGQWGFQWNFNIDAPPNFCLDGLLPPILDFGVLGPDTIRFSAPAAGGKFILTAGTEVLVESTLNALTRVFDVSGIEKVVVRFV